MKTIRLLKLLFDLQRRNDSEKKRKERRHLIKSRKLNYRDSYESDIRRIEFIQVGAVIDLCENIIIARDVGLRLMINLFIAIIKSDS